MRLSEHKELKLRGLDNPQLFFQILIFKIENLPLEKHFLWIFFRFTLRKITEVQVSSSFLPIVASKSNRAAAVCPHAP